MPIGAHTAKLKKQHPIEAELANLRDAHRLAIHIWEGNEVWKPNPSYVFPTFSYDTFNTRQADEIVPSMKQHDMPFMSMSLIPSARSGLALRPYNGDWNGTKHLGYLVDLSQDKAHPPLVLRAALSGLGSGGDPYDKAMRLKRKEHREAPSLTTLYAQFATENALYDAIASKRGSTLTREQLDRLGKYYDKTARLGPEKREEHLDYYDWINGANTITDFNEILVGASASHIKAIVVPYMEDPHHPADWFDPMTKLVGALAGLQHLNHHPAIDLPVVTYHVTKPHQGEFSYLAQGKTEFIQTALAACKELEAQGLFGQGIATKKIAEIKDNVLFDKLREGVSNALSAEVHGESAGLDIAKPLAKQKAVISDLEQQAREATPRQRG